MLELRRPERKTQSINSESRLVVIVESALITKKQIHKIKSRNLSPHPTHQNNNHDTYHLPHSKLVSLQEHS